MLRASRAGDIFHYRWAARRCLELIKFNNILYKIVIEGTCDANSEGDQVIDTSEYYSDTEATEVTHIKYFQLKHTLQSDKNFTVSGLKTTLKGFSKKYKNKNKRDIKFYFVTNRYVDDEVKEEFARISNGQETKNINIRKYIKEYTELDGEELQEFCSHFVIDDTEGDYDFQKRKLSQELLFHLPSEEIGEHINSLVSLIQSKVEPKNNGEITQGDILDCFGVSSHRELFPAPSYLKKGDTFFLRDQYEEIINQILANENPVIVHATGGVGKSTFAQQAVEAMSECSLGIVYDCFADGKYRLKTESRHLARVALTQIINELALSGICGTMIPGRSTDESLFRRFYMYLEKAIQQLREKNEDAKIMIFIDAADNAVTAAQEFGESCFAKDLLREKVPEGCKLVFLCRTERIKELEPLSYINMYELKMFSLSETQKHLEVFYNTLSDEQCEEFHRVTGGNPRVQVNILERGKRKNDDIDSLLMSLGSNIITLEDDYEKRLGELQDKNLLDKTALEDICFGLSILPPVIPLEVLVELSSIDRETIFSFISDFGYPLNLTDGYVHFRDEPTETWFRKRFQINNLEKVKKYTDRIKVLAGNNNQYSAEILPEFLLKSENYQELMDIALSDKFLPVNSFDARILKFYRLQFAFKAAIKIKNYKDAIKIAFLASEETSGSDRQKNVVKKHIGFFSMMENSNQNQKRAFSKKLKGEWEGSEYIYSAVLLVNEKSFLGDAVNYIRKAEQFLRREISKSKEEKRDQRMEKEEISWLIYAKFKISGIKGIVDFFNKFKVGSNWKSEVLTQTWKKIIILDGIEKVKKIDITLTSDFWIFATYAHELLKIGHIVSLRKNSHFLNFRKNCKFFEIDSNEGKLVILSLLEVFAANKCDNHAIIKILNKIDSIPMGRFFLGSFGMKERECYFRGIALKKYFMDMVPLDENEVYPSEYLKSDLNPNMIREKKEFEEVLNYFLPWYEARLHAITNVLVDRKSEHLIQKLDQQSQNCRVKSIWGKEYITRQVNLVFIDILIFSGLIYNISLDDTYDHLKNNSLFETRDFRKFILKILAANVFGCEKLLSQICKDLFSEIKSIEDEMEVESRASEILELVELFFKFDQSEAKAWGDKALGSLSEFGHEVSDRWLTILRIASRGSEINKQIPELSYRLLRAVEYISPRYVLEKYVSREETFQIASRFSFLETFSYLSRCRDRNKGDFESELSAIFWELLVNTQNPISSKYIIAFSPLFSEYYKEKILLEALDKEKSIELKNRMSQIILKKFSIDEIDSTESWSKLERIFEESNLDTKSVKSRRSLYEKQIHPSVTVANEEEKNLTKYIDSKFFSTSKEITDIYLRIKEDTNFYLDSKEFFSEIFKGVPDKNALDIVRELLNFEQFSKWDVESMFESIPAKWRERLDFTNYYLELLKQYGRQFAIEYIQFPNKEIIKNISPTELRGFEEEIFEHAVEKKDYYWNYFFESFIKTASKHLKPEENVELLDFALIRIERFIEKDFADGEWLEQNELEDRDKVLAKLLWATLSSPDPKIRWKAMHSIKNCHDFGLCELIDELIICLDKKDSAKNFVDKQLPFYELNSRLYLIIVLARISKDKTEILNKHKNIFTKILNDYSNTHILMRKFISEIIINIDKNFTDIFKTEIVKLAKTVGKTPFEIKKAKENLKYQKVSYHGDFWWGIDLPAYWFSPLGRIFNLSEKEITVEVTNIAKKVCGGKSNEDPRKSLIRERDTRHSHGSYPKVEDYSFYLGYHAMFFTAEKLLNQRELIEEDWNPSPWEDWFTRYLLTRNDGYWLAELRDSRQVIESMKEEDEQFLEISEEEFFKKKIFEIGDESWVIVGGRYSEEEYRRSVERSFSSALVMNTKTASALQSALELTNDSWNYRLPEYNDKDFEFEVEPFLLKGWITSIGEYNGLDRQDPLAAEIPYPLIQFGTEFVEKFQLNSDIGGKIWRESENGKIIARNYTWAEKKDNNSYEGNRGQFFIVSISFLKKIAHKLNCQIVLSSTVQKKFKERGQNEKKANKGHRIYLLSEDGDIRGTRSNYKFEPKDC